MGDISANRARAWHASGMKLSVLLAGAYAYVVYEMFIYAFAIHFNALFLVYCATLGIAGFALVAVTIDVSRCVPLVDARGAHVAGGFLVAVGAAFGLMWLAEDVPAMLRNAPSRSLVETGLFTNPVHVIDLAFVLPLHILAGVWIWQRHDAGTLLAPIMLAFGVLMALLQRGVSVPGDVSLCGYDDIPFASQLSVPLTSVRRPHYAMGTTAAEMITSVLTGESPDPRHVLFTPELVVRESTAPPPARPKKSAARNPGRKQTR